MGRDDRPVGTVRRHALRAARSSCCRPRPARRSPRSRRWWRQATRSLPSSRWITDRSWARRPAPRTHRRRACRQSQRAAPHQGRRRARSFSRAVSAVSGRGEVFKSGGRVVKNVTGYDLCKVIAGSWGTLAVMTDVTIKTLPKAETEATVLVLGLDDAAAGKAMAAAMGSYGDVSAAAHLPAGVAERIAATAAAHAAVTAFRLEGVAPSVAQRKAVLEQAPGAVRFARRARRGGLARLLARGARRHAVRGGTVRPASATSGAFRRRRPRAPRSAARSRARPARRSSTIGPVGSSGRLCRPRTMRMRRWCAPQSRPPAATRRSFARPPLCAPRSRCSRRSRRRSRH